MDLLRFFRVVAVAEAASFLVLLLVAMPLKYMADMPLAVKYTGWAHGLLFVLYLILCSAVARKYSWSFGRFFIAALASVVPLGPLMLEKRLKKEQADSGI